MGNTLSTWVSAYAGFDLPGPAPQTPVVLRKRHLDNLNGHSASRQKPRNPLHFLQISQAWEEIGRVCQDFHGENFDIEQDLNLQKPIKIAILDTGVYQDHAALVGRVSRVRNFVSRQCQADAQEDLTRDRHGHGTFCAALAVGGRYKVNYLHEVTGEPESLIFQNGVAPFAKVVVGKVLGADRKGDVEWLIKGIKWACDIDRADSRRPVNADIVSISVGMPLFHPELRDVVYKALQKGKIFVCCAGNEEEETSYNIQYPARFGDVICVGSQCENGQPTTFTPAGREVEFLGPGEDVWSASSKGTTYVCPKSGTFIAAPYIAGVCALLLAYAEKVGGPPLRMLVSHTQVMRKLLKRMSSMPGHHDPSAGFGNIIALRLLRYGPEFFVNAITEIVEVQCDETTYPSFENIHPLQPTFCEFRASDISRRISSDPRAMESLSQILDKEIPLSSFYTMIDSVLTGQSTNLPLIPEIKPVMDTDLEEVDLSLHNPSNIKDHDKMPVCVDLKNILDIYFAGYQGSTKKLILPEFKDIARFGLAEGELSVLKPTFVQIPGDVPIEYLLDVMLALKPTSICQPSSIIVEKLCLHDLTNPQEMVCRDMLETTVAAHQATTFTSVYIKDLEICNDSDSCIDTFLKSASVQLQAEVRTQTQKDGIQLKMEIEDASENKNPPIQFFYSFDEFQNDMPLTRATSKQNLGSQSKSTTIKRFHLHNELSTLLFSRTKQILNKELPDKLSVLLATAGKGYQKAINLLSVASLTNVVDFIDLRPETFDSLYSKRNSPHAIRKIELEGDPHLQYCPVSSEADVLLDRSRKIALVPVLVNIYKRNKELKVRELALPPWSMINDPNIVAASSILKVCDNLYIPGVIKFHDLLAVLDKIPHGEHGLVIHLQSLLFSAVDETHSARNIELAENMKIFVYNVRFDKSFFMFPHNNVKNMYELCLIFSSQQLVEVLLEECQKFAEGKSELTPLYHSKSAQMQKVTGLINYLQDGLASGVVDGDDVFMVFTSDEFKYPYPPLPQTPVSVPTTTLPKNMYRHIFKDTNVIQSAVKAGKIKNVTVAILSTGIDAFHPEFDTKLGSARGSSLDRNCPTSEAVIGLSYNAVPGECMMSINDTKLTLGTKMAALIAGASGGAVPFANIISIKVASADGETTPEWIIGGLKWLLEQEKNKAVAESDIILIPFAFKSFSFELYSLINELSAASKIVICAAGKASFMESQRIGYPGFYGDTLCIGSHSLCFDPFPYSGKGREVDCLALGDEEDTAWTNATAATHVASIVAYTLIYAEFIGGASLRSAISHNCVMRELIRRMCTKPGQHDERNGHGCIKPFELFQYGEDYFRRFVEDVTEEFHQIVVKHVHTRIRTTSVSGEFRSRSGSFGESRSRSNSFRMSRRQISEDPSLHAAHRKTDLNHHS